VIRRSCAALAIAVGAALGPSSLACSPPAPPALPEAAAASATDGASVSACSAARDPLHPMIVEWPATSRARLETASARGPVVVSYVGCTLKVLSDCRAGGPDAYDLVNTTPAEDHFDIGSEQDLYASLPLAAASLQAKLAHGAHLSLTYVAAGERKLKKPPEELDGACAGATHYVDSMVLGAFSLERRAEVAGSGRIAAFGSAAGGGRRETTQIDGSAGDVSACKDSGLDSATRCRASEKEAQSPSRLEDRAASEWT
jgi:hypothetical protein